MHICSPNACDHDAKDTNDFEESDDAAVVLKATLRDWWHWNGTPIKAIFQVNGENYGDWHDENAASANDMEAERPKAARPIPFACKALAPMVKSE